MRSFEFVREKSSQSNRIHFDALRDEKNRRFVLCWCKGEAQ